MTEYPSKNEMLKLLTADWVLTEWSFVEPEKAVEFGIVNLPSGGKVKSWKLANEEGNK